MHKYLLLWANLTARWNWAGKIKPKAKALFQKHSQITWVVKMFYFPFKMKMQVAINQCLWSGKQWTASAATWNAREKNNKSSRMEDFVSFACSIASRGISFACKILAVTCTTELTFECFICWDKVFFLVYSVRQTNKPLECKQVAQLIY